MIDAFDSVSNARSTCNGVDVCAFLVAKQMQPFFYTSHAARE
jgi:hypothetical protein